MTIFHLIFCFKLTISYKLVIFLEFTLFNLIFSCFLAELHSLTFLIFSFILSYFSSSLIIALNSSWLISMSINAWDTKVSMLSSLLLAKIRILSCFFLFLVMLSNFLNIPVVRQNQSKTCACFSNWCSNKTSRRNDTNSSTCCA